MAWWTIQGYGWRNGPAAYPGVRLIIATLLAHNTYG